MMRKITAESLALLVRMVDNLKLLPEKTERFQVRASARTPLSGGGSALFLRPVAMRGSLTNCCQKLYRTTILRLNDAELSKA
jgi:hypothetical protein